MKINGLTISPRANLSGVNLSGVNLSGANLSRANLYRANLSWANLSWANLSRANLSGANLSGVNLSGANLSGADLSGANLSRANLSRANLSWANLSIMPSIKFLAQLNLKTISDKLTTELINRDIDGHPKPELFKKWAQNKNAPCPYVNEMRMWIFNERKECYEPNKPRLTDLELIKLICKEKNITYYIDV